MLIVSLSLWSGESCATSTTPSSAAQGAPPVMGKKTPMWGAGTHTAQSSQVKSSQVKSAPLQGGLRAQHEMYSHLHDEYRTTAARGKSATFRRLQLQEEMSAAHANGLAWGSPSCEA